MKNKATILLSMLLWLSCKEVDKPQDLGYTYFPIEIGNYWIYQMDSIAYNALGDHDTLSYQVKESITKTVSFIEGDTQYVMEHFYRFSDKEAWRHYKQSLITKDLQGVEQDVDGKRTLNLIFPISEYSFWDRNLYNTEEETIVHYMGVSNSYSISSDLYSDCVTVKGEVTSNPYFEKSYTEVYARHTGLISKEVKNIEIQHGKSSGSQYKKTLIEARIN